MTIRKDEAISSIISDFEQISNTLLEQLDYLDHFITSGEMKVSEEVAGFIQKNEEEIDKREVKISDKIINTIVLHSPMASELRRLVSCYRILISLERIGDLVVNITGFIKKIKTPVIYEKYREVLSNMTILSIKMVRKSLLSFLNDDKEFAIWTIKNDIVFDEINSKLLKKLIKESNTAETNKNLLVSLITIKEMMSNIERIADHATNIAEAAIYSIEGKDIRHHHDQKE